MNINGFILAVTVELVEPGPPVCPTCAPPESDLIPMLVVGSVLFVGGWVVRVLKARRWK